MKPHIGYYAHHHGRGHLSRAEAILKKLHTPATVLTSATPPEPLTKQADVLALPLDTPAPDTPPPETLHYAPVGCTGLRRRMTRIAEWIDTMTPSLVVVDVSVEVALFARLCSLPVVVMRQHGDRTDLPHRQAYEAAAALVAPYPAFLEDDTAPAWVRRQTHYVGGFSRFDDRHLSTEAARDAAGLSPDEAYVVVLYGRGGDGVALERVAAAARACPDYTWLVVGRPGTAGLPSNVQVAGWVDDPFSYLRAADVVVSAAGNNAVMEVAAARRPLVCIPEPRPFGEQANKAKKLDDSGLAVTCDAWPPAEAWPRLLRRATTLDPSRMAALVPGDGATRAAEILDTLARRFAA